MSIIFPHNFGYAAGKSESLDRGDLPDFNSGTSFAIFQHGETYASTHMLLNMSRRTGAPVGKRFFKTSGPVAVPTRVCDKAARNYSREYALTT